MKIAVTSPSFSKHPDLIKEMNQSFENFKLNSDGKRFTQDELIDYLTGFDAAIVGLDEITPKVVDALPELKIIAKYGVGLNNIDLEYCAQKNVKIGWTGGVNRLSVAELVLGNTISLLRNLYVSSNHLKGGEWIKNGGEQLSGKTVGIIGVGHIGKEVIRLLKPFNCTILVNDIIEQKDYYSSVGAVEVSKNEIYQKADVISVHTPLTDETKNLLNAEAFQQMKSNAVVINSARGGIVDELALIEALQQGKIGGAALDVYEVEPPINQELIRQFNLICTPHIGGNSKEAVYAMGMSAIGYLKKEKK